MKRRTSLFAILVLAAIAAIPAKADPPVYEPRVVPGASKVIPAGRCTADSIFELGAASYLDEEPYTKCERLKVVFGPIWSKPGQNDVLIQPVTFERPMYPGYMIRFKPDLVGVDGQSPKVQDVHLHHGTWLNACSLGASCPTRQLPVDPARPYGWGPWLASGEEKTVAVWPKGYGLKILESDQWLFLHMIHNATPQTFPVWVTYDIDFVPLADAEKVVDGKPLIRNTKGIWLDVGDCSWHSQCRKDTFNPVFNVHRGAGTAEDGVCIFPRENCSFQNTLADKSAQQGIPVGEVYDDWTIPEDGTLVIMGGHLHFGGLRDDVYLVRDGQAKLIHISDALYFEQENFNPETWKPEDAFDLDKNLVGGAPTSWDMVMTGTSSDFGWRVRVKKGDKLRLEGVYDSKIGTWYEQMGIVMTWLAPGDTSGIDPFDPNVEIGKGLNPLAITPKPAPGYTLPGGDLPACNPGYDADTGKTWLCVRGQPTHARVPTSGDHWKCELNGCPDIARRAVDGPVVRDIHMGGFRYGVADFGVIGTPVGIPRVEVNKPVTFWNVDTADYMWHTVTRCANPCSGTTSSSYPIPDGAYDDLLDPVSGKTPNGETVDDLLAARGPDLMDFDSGALGVGTGAVNKISWTWTPTRTGTYTFFCRIHPSMRGAVRVVAPSGS